MITLPVEVQLVIIKELSSVNDLASLRLVCSSTKSIADQVLKTIHHVDILELRRRAHFFPWDNAKIVIRKNCTVFTATIDSQSTKLVTKFISSFCPHLLSISADLAFEIDDLALLKTNLRYFQCLTIQPSGLIDSEYLHKTFNKLVACDIMINNSICTSQLLRYYAGDSPSRFIQIDGSCPMHKNKCQEEEDPVPISTKVISLHRGNQGPIKYIPVLNSTESFSINLPISFAPYVRMPNLLKIHLSVRTSNERFALGEWLVHSTQLEVLHVECNLTREQLDLLKIIVPQMKKLRCLGLEAALKTELTGIDLPLNSGLERLHLGHPAKGGWYESALPLSFNIDHSASYKLRHLRLVGYFANKFEFIFPHLEEISLTITRPGYDQSLAGLLRCLFNSPHLSSFQLGAHSIDSKCVKTIVQLLSHTKSMRLFDLNTGEVISNTLDQCVLDLGSVPFHPNSFRWNANGFPIKIIMPPEIAMLFLNHNCMGWNKYSRSKWRCDRYETDFFFIGNGPEFSIENTIICPEILKLDPRTPEAHKLAAQIRCKFPWAAPLQQRLRF